MKIIHGSSRCLARAVRRAGPHLTLRLGKKRFLSPLFRWDSPDLHRADWNTDLFLAYPDAAKCTNTPSNYSDLVSFYRGNKYEQWQVLKEFFQTPKFDQPPFVRRPLRHEGGVGFEIVNQKPAADHDSRYYWRSLWRRDAEYRVFFVRGKKVLTLLKRVPSGTSQDIPWNAGVSSFVTVHDHENDRLRHSKFYAKAEEFFKTYPFHLCAVDVLYRTASHCVVEVNFSPGVLIEDNLRTLTQALLKRNDTSHSNTGSHTVTPPVAATARRTW